MMNGAKKSDSLIIPAKPANKAGPPAAEPVKGSSGTERNAELQSTVRTQSREAVSQAQDGGSHARPFIAAEHPSQLRWG